MAVNVAQLAVMLLPSTSKACISNPIIGMKKCLSKCRGRFIFDESKLRNKKHQQQERKKLINLTLLASSNDEHKKPLIYFCFHVVVVEEGIIR